VKTISFKVSDDEARRIRSLAKREQLSVSEYLRRRAVGSAPQSEVAKIRCEFTGAEIFAAPGGEAPLSVQETRRLLADFP
jgi:hypothetical protein